MSTEFEVGVAEAQVNQELLNRNNYLARRVDDLVSQLQQKANELEDARRNHKQDIRIIGERLIEVANDRDLCSDYDDVVDDVNERLYVKLPVRERDFAVSVTIIVKVRDEDEARREVSHFLEQENSLDGYSFSIDAIERDDS